MVIRNKEFTEDIADEQNTASTTGIVTKVFPHDDPDDFSNHEVNVKLSTDEEEPRRMPVHVGQAGQVRTPQKDDIVEVSFLDSNTQAPYVSGFVYTDRTRAPLGRAGHWRNEWDSDSSTDQLYVEAEPRSHAAGEPDTVRMAVKSDGLSDPVARIEIDLSGSEPVIRLTRGEEEQGNTDMGLELDFGSGEFKIGDGDGYGITSDGNGNFTWYEQSVDFVDDGSTITW